MDDGMGSVLIYGEDDQLRALEENEMERSRPFPTIGSKIIVMLDSFMSGSIRDEDWITVRRYVMSLGW